MYDVVIVGAGPAGSTVARYASKRGLKVCLVDKDHFPRDKPCGGGFSYGIIDEFSWLRSSVDDFLKGICKVGVIHSPNGRISLRSRIDMAVALRTEFDNVIFTNAISEGASVICGHRVKSISIDDASVRVSTHKGESIRARAIVGADGITSLVARTTGLNTKWPSKSITPCNVVEIPVKEEQVTEFFTEDRHYHFFANVGGKPGYGWIFPKRETINVGLGMVGKHSKRLPVNFRRFVKQLQQRELIPEKIDISGARGGLVPTAGPIEKTYTDRCLLVGDSAGMVNPLTGGGIHYAMKAGRIAADILTQSLEEDNLTSDNLSIYQKSWKKEFGHEIGPLLLAQKIFISPFTDVLFEIGRRDVTIQQMVSDTLSEASDGVIDVKTLTIRALSVILRSALHLM